MADPTPTPPPEEKKKRTRNQVNQAIVKELDKADQLCLTAKKEDYADKLRARDLDSDFISSLSDDVTAARAKISSAVNETSAKTGATADEANASKALLQALQEVQAAAKQKYGRSQPKQLGAYHVNQRLDANRATLEQTSQDIIDKLSSDTLPGFTSGSPKVANLTTLRTAYVNSKSPQMTARTAAVSDRKAVADLVKSITDRRIALQYAVDAEWPYSNPANAGIRTEFGLPPNRPFNG